MENLFRQEVADNKKYRLEGTISLVQPPLFKVLTLLILFVLIISLVFLSLGSYTRKEKVSGILQPNTGLIKLGAPQSGIVSEILVKEGQLVKRNQPILRIISEKYSVEGEELNQAFINQYQFQLNSLKQQLTQQKSQHKLQIDELSSSRSNIEKKLVQLEVQNEIFSERIEINNKLVRQIATLANTGYISELELKRQNDTLLSLKQQSSSIQSEKLSLQNQAEQLDNQLIQLPFEQAQITIQLKTQIEDIKTQLVTMKQKKQGELRSPVDGIVSGLLVKVGKSLSNNQNVISILPAGSYMQAVIYVPTEMFGFIEKEQKSRIRYHAFPYEKFGIYEGIVSEISTNVILPNETEIPGIISQPSYRVVIDLASESIHAYGKKIPLRSGMRLDADIIIEERTLIHWLFDPVFSIGGRL